MKTSVFYDALSGLQFYFPHIPLPKETKRYCFAHPIYFQPFSTIRKVLQIALNQNNHEPELLKLGICALTAKLWEQKNPVLLLTSGARIVGNVENAKQVKEFVLAASYVYSLTEWGRTKIPKLRITEQTSLNDLARWADLINDLKFTRLERSEFEKPTTLDEKLAMQWKKFIAYSKTPWRMPSSFIRWIENKYAIPIDDPDWAEILDSGVLFRPVQTLYIENGFGDSIYKLQHLMDLIHLIRDHNAEKSCLLSHMIVKWLQEKLKAWTDMNPDLAVELFMSEISGSGPRSNSVNPQELKVHTISKASTGDLIDSIELSGQSLASILMKAKGPSAA